MTYSGGRANNNEEAKFLLLDSKSVEESTFILFIETTPNPGIGLKNPGPSEDIQAYKHIKYRIRP